jgi:hypothetical protein
MKREITMLQTSTFQNIEESLKQLPHSLQVEVFHYIEFLKSNYAKQSSNTITQSLELKSVMVLAFGKERFRCQEISMRHWKSLRGIRTYAF